MAVPETTSTEGLEDYIGGQCLFHGKGLYQEKGRPVKTINQGETIICAPNIEHWHGASPESRMTHLAITNDKGKGGVVWLKPVTDDEYKARGN